MPVETADSPPEISVFEETRRDLEQCWRAMPDKGFFCALLVVWSLLFQLWGNSVFGWIDTPSLFQWMYFVFDSSPDDAHGKLVPFVVLGLFWWKRKELLQTSKQIWWPALVIVISALLLHMLGYLVQQTRISMVAYFTGLYGLTGLVWGRAWLRATVFPMFLFGFCIPLGTMGDTLTFPMRMAATNATAIICDNVLGIGIIKQGTQLFDATGRFRYEVAAACGGIRSLIAMLALTTIYAFVGFNSKWKRSLMIFSAFPLAIAGNIFRLVSIIVAAEAFGKGAGDFVHEKLSLLPYLPVLAGIILLGVWLREDATLPATKPALALPKST